MMGEAARAIGDRSFRELGGSVDAIEVDLATIDGVDRLYQSANGRPVDALLATPAVFLRSSIGRWRSPAQGRKKTQLKETIASTAMNTDDIDDTQLADAVFDALVNGVHAARVDDPAWDNPMALTHSFSITRHGRELTFRKGDGRPLLQGEIRWNGTGARLAKFSVWRGVDSNHLLLKLGAEHSGTLQNVVENILRAFLVTRPNQDLYV
jgi:hypothetical protein